MAALEPRFREEHVAIIGSFIRHHVAESGARGIVLGMSGGVDSSLVAKLCSMSVGPDKVLGVALPERAGGQEEKDARNWAKQLGIGFRVVEIGSMAGMIVRALRIPKSDRVARGNVHARARMIALYQIARHEARLVIGTGNKSELATGYFCYDAKTRAMTPDGPKHYWELQKGSIVFSLDLETGKVVETPVEDVHVFDYQGELIGIRTTRLNLLVTPNHRLLISRNHGSGPLSYEMAESRFAGGNTCIPVPEPWDGLVAAPPLVDTASFLKSNLSYNARPPVHMPIEDFLYLMGLHIGDGTVSRGIITRRTKSGMTHQERIAVRDALGRMAPLPEGLERERTYDYARIFIAAADGKRSREPLLELLGRSGIQATRTPTVVAFTNRALTAALDDCGYGSHNKQIPCWVLKLPASQLRCLYNGLMDSDGTATGYAYYTTSERLAYQMVELCMKLGLHAWVAKRGAKNAMYNGRLIRTGESFEVRIGIESHNLVFQPHNMRRVRYSGKIWCPSVPPYENLLVERHGKMAFCGNTKFGDGGVDFLPIGDLYKTQVREMASFLGVPKRIVDKVPTAGLWKGQTDEGELGIPYNDLDRVLLGIEIHLTPEEIAAQTAVSLKKVRHVEDLVARSVHKRKPPLIPKVGIRTFGLDWRE